MGSQKECDVPVDEHLRSKPVNGEAKIFTEFQLDSSLLHKENIEFTSQPIHQKNLKRAFQPISTKGVSPQYQEDVAKSFPARILPLIGASPLVKCNGGILTGNHNLDCHIEANAQVSTFMLHEEGKSLASSLALLDATQSLYSSEDPTHLLKHNFCAGKTTRRPPETELSTFRTSPTSNNISQKYMYAPPLAPQKAKDIQKLTHLSKRGLDYEFEKQQTVIPSEHVAANSSDGDGIRAMKALQNTQCLERSTACFQVQNDYVCAGSNSTGVRGDKPKLQIFLDAKAYKVNNASSRKVSFENGMVSGHLVGSQKVGVLETEGMRDKSAEINRSSSKPGPGSSGQKKRFRESIASIAMEELGRNFPRSRLTIFPAYAPVPVAAPVFSCGEPSLPLLITCPQRPSEAIQTSTHSHENCSTRTHISPLDLRKFPCQNLEDSSKENMPLWTYQKRFINLQAFLRLCDEADQMDLLQALRSLSAPARSGHAFNLETRALRLSVEEGKEMVRLKMLNVMGRNLTPKGKINEKGSTLVGTRLPTPIVPACLTNDT